MVNLVKRTLKGLIMNCILYVKRAGGKTEQIKLQEMKIIISEIKNILGRVNNFRQYRTEY